ncbi:MAG: hypothetical protein IT260_05355 [Saprospiraceae bacterium]|nr:hypothetical protein [Saprospiraceae bacterium]
MEHRHKSLETLLVLITALLGCFLWLKQPWLLHAALLLAATGVFFPWLAQKIHAGWSLLAQGLGWLNGRLLLSLVFYLILTPVALLARLSRGSTSFSLRKKKPDESYFIDRQHVFEPKDLENTW